MLLQPANLPALCAAIRDAAHQGQRVREVDLSALNQVVEYTPEDMTVTAEAGLSLGDLQARLAAGGQWLPIDPPHPQSLTLASLLATNASGPRRFGYGTVREHLIGIKVVLADGRVVKSGGRVVKNVAGYDLQKLFVGSHGSLGVIVEATFKLRPRPAAECFVAAPCASIPEAESRLQQVLDSELTPVVLDWHNLRPGHTLLLGFAGSCEEVEWQLAQAKRLDFNVPASLAPEDEFWRTSTDPLPTKISVLPTRLGELIRHHEAHPFIAHAGNGILWHRSATEPATPQVAGPLHQRIKAEFDPRNIFPCLPL